MRTYLGNLRSLGAMCVPLTYARMCRVRQSRHVALVHRLHGGGR